MHPIPDKDVIAAAIEGYRPKVVDQQSWSRIRPFVTETVRSYQPHTVDSAKMALTVVSQVASWADRAFVPLDVEEVFHPDNIERFMARGYRGGLDPSSVRSKLRSIGRAVTVTAPWRPRGQGYRRVPLMPPYTPADLRRLHEAAGQQANAVRASTFETLLALGLGAGVTSSEAANVRGVDFAKTPQGWIVHLGSKQREVPIDVRYQDALAAFAETAGAEYLIPGPVTHNKVNHKIQRLRLGPFTPPLRVARLRTTWIADLMNRGIPINEVMRAAGLETLHVFRDLLHLVQPWSDADYRLTISGAKSCQ